METPILQNQAQIPSAHASVGPAIAVVVVIAVLGVVAGMIGRICAGRSLMGYGHFDVEAWMDSKFSSCIDGNVDDVPIRRYRPPPLEVRPEAQEAAVEETVKEDGEEVGEAEEANSYAQS